jgi:hypothetical protein
VKRIERSFSENLRDMTCYDIMLPEGYRRQHAHVLPEVREYTSLLFNISHSRLTLFRLNDDIKEEVLSR